MATPTKERQVFSTYADAESAVTYPVASITPRQYYDYSVSYSPVTDSFAVPSSSPYAVDLFQPIINSGITLTVGEASRTLVDGSSPSNGQVAVDRGLGRLTFHSSDAGGTCAYTITPIMSMISASDLHLLQAHILVTQDFLAGAPRILVHDALFPGMIAVPSTATAHFARFDFPSSIYGTLKLVFLEILAPTQFEGGALESGTTTVELSVASDFSSSLATISITDAQSYNSKNEATIGANTITAASAGTVYLRVTASARHTNVTTRARFRILTNP